MQQLAMALTLLAVALSNMVHRRPTGEVLEAYNLIAAQANNDFPVISPTAGLPELQAAFNSFINELTDEDEVRDVGTLIAKVQGMYGAETADGDASNEDLNYGSNALQGDADADSDPTAGDSVDPLAGANDQAGG